MRNLSAVSRGATQSEERAARNEVYFREANEKLGEKRVELEASGLTPFLCECSDPACTELIRLSLEEYEYIRSRPKWFLAAAGHDADARATAEDHGTYVIIEKDGVAGRIAEDQNPRK